MKKLVFLLTISSLVSLSAWAAANPLSPVELPCGKDSINGQRIIPEPPEKGTEQWNNDSATYFKARELRRLKREVTQADKDLLDLLNCTISVSVGQVTVVDSLIAKFREPYITWLKTYGCDSAINIPTLGDKKKFPYLCRLDSLCEKMKSYGTADDRYRVRQRPYYYFHDYYKNGKLSESPTNYDSYPSGHGYFAGLFELAMAYIDPQNIEAIKRNSETFGYQRLILGAHWENDVWAGRKLGAATFDIARTSPLFQNLLDSAKVELARYRANHSVVVTNPKPTQLKEDIEGDQSYDIVRKDVENAIAVLKKNCDMTPTLKMDIQINRTFFCDGYHNSLCLPFSISADEWSSATNNPLAAGTLKRFVSAVVDNDTLIISLEVANSIDAGKPYLVSFETGDNIVNPVFKQVRVTTTQSDTLKDAKATCNGIFAPYQLPIKGEESPYLLLGYDGEHYGLFWPKADDSYLKGFRAYFETNLSTSSPIRHGMKAVLADHKVPTDITTIVWKEGDIVKRVENGNVVIIKDGTKYNMNGQIIR